MDRAPPALDGAGPGVGDAVAAEHGDAALVQEGHAVSRESGEALGVGVPAAEALAAQVAAGAHEQDVALLDAQALPLLGGFELAAADLVGGF